MPRPSAPTGGAGGAKAGVRAGRRMGCDGQRSRTGGRGEGSCYDPGDPAPGPAPRVDASIEGFRDTPMSHASSPIRTWPARLVLALMMALTVQGAYAQDDTGTPPPLAGETDTNAPCFDGRLRIRDLEQADEAIAEGLELVLEAGRSWEEDAALFALRLGCPLLETGFQLEGTFFSRTAQAFFATGTGEIQASDDDPNTIPRLETSQGVSVQFVYRSLVRAGFDEDSLLGAANGVTIRPNTEEMPFGPPSAPKGDVYFHVSIEDRGEVVDVWVASKDGTVYRYTGT